MCSDVKREHEAEEAAESPGESLCRKGKIEWRKNWGNTDLMKRLPRGGMLMEKAKRDVQVKRIEMCRYL